MLRLINEVLTMAPEFGDQAVTLPLGAILDWTMALKLASPPTGMRG